MMQITQIRIAALGIAIIWISLFTFILKDSSKVAILLFDMNSTFMPYPLTIQNIMWLMFFIGLGELYNRYLASKDNMNALKSGYLNEEAGVFYNSKDLIYIHKSIIVHNNSLSKLIQSLFVRYQASQKSPNETHQMLNSQIEFMQFKIDVDYNMIRYLSWLIPTLGFIGTVIGIANALTYAGIPGKAEESNFLSELTTRLAVAFDTTLVALIMSSILVYIMHLLQGREESTVQQCGEYCLNHFINKLISK